MLPTHGVVTYANLSKASIRLEHTLSLGCPFYTYFWGANVRPLIYAYYVSKKRRNERESEMSVLHQTSRPIRIEVNAHYYSLGDSYFCCGERLDALYCVKCDEVMACYYCEHNYNEAHDCDEV